MFEVSKEFHFEAAHSLPHLPEGHQCRNLHGHSYRFRVVCRGPLDKRGFVLDYAEITDEVKPLVERLDHCAGGLNALFDFPTTAEHLARWIYDELKPTLPSLVRIEFFETASTQVVYPV